MNEIRYSQGLVPETQAQATFSQRSAKLNTDAALVQSAQDISDYTLENLAVLLTHRQIVAKKMLANLSPIDMSDILADTMDYINDELRKLLAL